MYSETTAHTVPKPEPRASQEGLNPPGRRRLPLFQLPHGGPCPGLPSSGSGLAGPGGVRGRRLPAGCAGHLPPQITWQAAGCAPMPGLARGCLPGALAEPWDQPWRCVGGSHFYPEAFGLSGPFLPEIISFRWDFLGKNPKASSRFSFL